MNVRRHAPAMEDTWVGSLLSRGEWLIREEGWHPEKLPFYETLFTLANGTMGTRGGLEQGAQTGLPGTYFAGVFDATPHFFSELVNGPRWIGLKVIVEGETVDMEKGDVLTYERALDMRQGVLAQLLRWRDPQGRIIRLEVVRLVHRVTCGALIQGRITPENYGGTLTLKGGLDGYTFNRNIVDQIRVKHFHLTGREDQGEQGVYLEMKTMVSGILLGMASRLRLCGAIRHSVEYGVDRIDESQTAVAQQGESLAFDKRIAFYTSREGEDIRGNTLEQLDHMCGMSVEQWTEKHCAAWRSAWEDADVQIEGDDVAQQSLRFCLFHLMQLGGRTDGQSSIGARGLHGEGYRGHVFWDTEIFMLPFYIYTDPEVARSLLMYRARRLDAARKNARVNGYWGAQFPWESADTGEEVTPKVLGDPFTGDTVRIWTGEEEHHIVADVAFGVHHYAMATGDEAFLAEHGGEILLETARFWTRRAVWNDQADRYDIRKVIGPDEFHEHVDNSVYTNAMARWNLHRALSYAEGLRDEQPDHWRRLKDTLGLDEDELEAWRRVADGLYIPQDAESGVYEEFEGYFALQDEVVSMSDEHGMPLLPAEVEGRIADTQLIKQADVVLLQYLLGDAFDPRNKRVNFEYYEPRTTHRSSLSSSIYALMGVEVGEYGKAYAHFLRTARVDLDDLHGNTTQGIHTAAMGGAWQAAVHGFAGMRIREGQLSFDPWLPEGWERMAFTVRWRGNRLRVVVTREGLRAHLDPRSPWEEMEIRVCGQRRWVKRETHSGSV